MVRGLELLRGVLQCEARLPCSAFDGSHGRCLAEVVLDVVRVLRLLFLDEKVPVGLAQAGLALGALVAAAVHVEVAGHLHNRGAHGLLDRLFRLDQVLRMVGLGRCNCGSFGQLRQGLLQVAIVAQVAILTLLLRLLQLDLGGGAAAVLIILLVLLQIILSFILHCINIIMIITADC